MKGQDRSKKSDEPKSHNRDSWGAKVVFFFFFVFCYFFSIYASYWNSGSLYVVFSLYRSNYCYP